MRKVYHTIPSYYDHEGKLVYLNEVLPSLQAEVAALKQQQSEAAAQLTELTAKLEGLSAALARQQTEIAELKEALQAKKKPIR